MNGLLGLCVITITFDINLYAIVVIGGVRVFSATRNLAQGSGE